MTFTANPGKWVVNAGIHHGTMVSRDSGVTEYDSEEQAREGFANDKTFWARMGYSIWFAYLIDDQGNKTVLDNGVPYR